ncbi:High-affinity branched-chain amino acid transport system permease protein LivH [bacterium HR23]|nr:High-affinity branched-chain amino acid transport system permease protein LivH [bacterium HR23]
MQLFGTIVLDGLIFASWLFLVSAGLTFIYGVLRILNVAHGSLYALGAYMGAFLVLRYLQTGAPVALTYLLLLVAAIFIGITAGSFIERVFLRRVYGREDVVQLLVTFAILLILEDVIKLSWGVTPLLADKPYSALGQVRFVGVSYARYSLLLIGVALVAGAILWLVVNRTRLGKFITAVITDREVSATLGINVPRVYIIAFILGGIFAALGGAFTSPMQPVVPGIGVEVIVLSFAVVAIGGLGSVGGAALGSLLVGMARAAAVHLRPELDLFAIYLIMALVLLFRPQGLFGAVETRRI